MENESWKGKHFSYFCNKECEYFPCHKDADIENFNCLFCYCPLYVLGRKCGGNYTYLSNGVKDCSNCLYPHKKEHYGDIIKRHAEIVGRIKEKN